MREKERRREWKRIEKERTRLRRRGRDEKERRGGRRKISSPCRTCPATKQRCRGNERGNASVQRGRRRTEGGKKPVTGEVNTRRWCYPPLLSSSLQSAESLRGSGVWRSWKISCYVRRNMAAPHAWSKLRIRTSQGCWSALISDSDIYQIDSCDVARFVEGETNQRLNY
jgi:hypothetical protein